MFRLCCVAFSALLIALATAAQTDGECEGSLTYGDYNLEWFSPMDGYLTITASATTADSTWIAVGISLSNDMLNSDIVIGAQNASDPTQYFIEDRWATTRTMPVYDEQQDLSNVSLSRENGVSTIEFTRKLNTGDATQDIALGDGEQCVYFLWAFGGPVTRFETPAEFGEHAKDGTFDGSTTYCFTECVLDNDDGAGTVMISFVSLIIAAVAAISFF